MSSTPRTLLGKIVRDPLLHFLVAGALIYGVYLLRADEEAAESDSTIVVTAADVEWLESSWEMRWNRPPTPDERTALIRDYVRETVLYREALSMGLDQDDTIIRRRLAQKLEFLTQDLATMNPPTEAEIQEYFAGHAERYQEPDRVTFTQLYFNPDSRGDAALTDAEEIKAELQGREDPTDDIADFGDALMLQRYYPARSGQEIAALFGSGFATAVIDLEPGQWHGPVLSGYGVHLVYVHSHEVPPPPSLHLADIAERVREDLESDRRAEANKEYLAHLLTRYDVVIEATGEPITFTGAAE